MITVHHRPWGSYVTVGKSDHLTAFDIQYAKGVLDADYPLPSIYCHSLVSRQTDFRSDETNFLSMALSFSRRM